MPPTIMDFISLMTTFFLLLAHVMCLQCEEEHEMRTLCAGWPHLSVHLGHAQREEGDQVLDQREGEEELPGADTGEGKYLMCGEYHSNDITFVTLGCQWEIQASSRVQADDSSGENCKDHAL